MAKRKFRDSYCITQDTAAYHISNKRGMAHRTKTQSNKRDRQHLDANLRWRILIDLEQAEPINLFRNT